MRDEEGAAAAISRTLRLLEEKTGNRPRFNGRMVLVDSFVTDPDSGTTYVTKEVWEQLKALPTVPIKT